MSFHAANPADFSDLSRVRWSSEQEPFDSNDGGELRPSTADMPLESHCNCGELPQPVCR